MTCTVIVLVAVIAIELIQAQTGSPRPSIIQCLPQPPICACSPNVHNNCLDPPLNRSQDLCYLSCCCELYGSDKSTFALSSSPLAENALASEAIAVTAFVPYMAMPGRENWVVMVDMDIPEPVCNFRLEPTDAHVTFNGIARQSAPLVASSWSSVGIQLPPNIQVIGFQLSVYARAQGPACLIASFQLGEGASVFEFDWQQFLVTDSDAILRRYVYRGDTILSIDGIRKPPTLSLIMAHNHQNGSCWIDCVEIQLLYLAQITPAPMTTSGTTTGPTTTATAPATSSTTKTTSVTVASVVSESMMVLDDQEELFAASVVIGLAVALGVVCLLSIVSTVIALYLWRRPSPSGRSEQGSVAAPTLAQQDMQGAAAPPSIYQSHGLSTRYEMLELAVPHNQTNYAPGTALTNNA
jgi:hypothetical protein